MKHDDPDTKGQKEHPSSAQRKKLEQARKLRLTQTLRENLKKRKEQVRGRKNSILESSQNKD